MTDSATHTTGSGPAAPGTPAHRAEHHSPAGHLAAACAAAGGPDSARLREVPFRAQVELRLDPDTAPAHRDDAAAVLGCPLPRPGRASGDGHPWVLGCGPDWYLVVHTGTPDGPWLAGRLAAVLDVDGSAGGASVVDVSGQRTMLELTGPHARAVLAHGCALDLHPRVFPAGGYAQTLLARATVGLLCVEAGTAYRILVRASYADHLTRWLLDAMADHAVPLPGSDVK